MQFHDNECNEGRDANPQPQERNSMLTSGTNSPKRTRKSCGPSIYACTWSITIISLALYLNKGSKDKIYPPITKNHFDVIKSFTAFYDSPYYCHECKKAYTKRDKHKCSSKCLSCFTYAKDKKCEGNEITCEKCNRKFFGKRCFKNLKVVTA